MEDLGSLDVSSILNVAMDLSNQTADIAGQMSAVAKDSMRTSQQKKEAEVILGKQRAADEAKATKYKADLAATAGINPDNPAQDVLFQLAGMARQAVAQLRANDAAITEIDNTSFFDNPLAAISGHFARPGLAAGSEASIKKAETASKLAQQINIGIQTGAATMDAVNKSVTASTMAAQAKLVAANAQLAGDKIEMEALGFQADATAAQMRGNDNVLQAYQAQRGMINQDIAISNEATKLQMATEDQARQEELFPIQKRNLIRDQQIQEIQAGQLMDTRDQKAQDEAARLTALADQAKSMKWIAEKAKLSVDLPIDPNGDPRSNAIKLTEYLTRTKNDPVLGPKLQALQYVSNAMQAIKNVTGFYPPGLILGTNPADAYTNSSILNDKPSTSKEEEVKSYIEEMVGLLHRPVETLEEIKNTAKSSTATTESKTAGARIGVIENILPDAFTTTDFKSSTEGSSTANTLGQSRAIKLKAPLDVKDPEERKRIINTTIESDINRMKGNVEAGGKDNLFGYNSPAETAAFGRFTKTKFYQQVLSEQIKNGQTQITSEGLVTDLFKAAESGIIKRDEILPLMKLYIDETVHYNNLQGNFTGRGLPEQNSFIVPLRLPRGEVQYKDLYNDAELAQYITAQGMLMNRGFVKKLMDESGVGSAYDLIGGFDLNKGIKKIGQGAIDAGKLVSPENSLPAQIFKRATAKQGDSK
jgi:hypothetical protein